MAATYYGESGNKTMVLPYLLLVSVFSGNFQNFKEYSVNIINDSPYDSVAVGLISPYETNIYTEKDFDNAVRLYKEKCKKDIWPWVFFNRFVGYEEGQRALSELAKKPYFQKIKGMDIYNQTGALKDLMDIWGMSLTIAKKIGSPGIVADLEAYNNYTVYSVSYLAKKTGKSNTEVMNQLRRIGKNLVDAANEIYPDAIIFFPFTGLSTLNPYSNKKDYRTVTYIVQGMLERARDAGYKLKFIDGGEVDLFYCNESLSDLQARVRKVKDDYASILKIYPNLDLGGITTLWNDPQKKKNWAASGKCGNSSLKNIDDFKPLLQYLLESYNYVWIYAGGGTDYNPYTSNSYPVFNKVIGEALSASRGNK